MSIRVTCPNCGKGIKAPDHYAGRAAKCPGCQAAVTIPQPGAMAAPPPPPPSRPSTPPPFVTPPPAPSEQRPAHPRVASAGASRGRWGFLAGCIAATALCGAIGIGVVVYVLNQADKVVDRVLEETRLPQQVAVEPTDTAPSATETEQAPAAPDDPETAAAKEALAQLRESLGGEIPELEGLLGMPLEGANRGESTQQSTDPEEVKLVEVVSIELTPADLKEFRLTNTLELEIHNTSDKVLATFSIDCQLKSPGRPIPWAEAVIFHRIPGGLLPGESRKLSLAMTGGFANVEIPKDAETIGVVTRVEWHQPKE